LIFSGKLSGCNNALVLFLILFLFVVPLVRPPSAFAVSNTSSIWSVVKSPNPSTVSVSNDILSGVSAISNSDVWAVGSYSSSDGNNIASTIAEHWNGTSWSVVPTPNVGTGGSVLQAVSAFSSNDVWAVGESNASGEASYDTTLIEHYNGSNWSVIPSPNPGNDGDFLTAVITLASNNAWAVGWFDNPETGELAPLIIHWNGTLWGMVTQGVPDGGDIILEGITAVSPSDIWAVGDTEAETNFEMHWNGTAWGDLTSASFPTGGQETLHGAAALSSSNVWAVGSYAPTVSAELQTLIVHWNGTAWSQVKSPDVDAYFNELYGVAAISSSNVWAVGLAYTTNGLSFHTLIEHWNGKAWSIISSPNVMSGDELDGITKSSSTSLWAAGTYDSTVKGNPGLRTLTMDTNKG
jgi:hypothetical protein